MRVAQLVDRLTRVRSSTLLEVLVPEIQNRSISGFKIGCAPVPELVTATVATPQKKRKKKKKEKKFLS